MPNQHLCHRCGAKIVAQDRMQGMCPSCLLELGMREDSMVVITGTGAPAAPPPTPDELAPLFPQFEILEILGQGGMGVVYKARARDLDRMVALKVLPAALGRDPAFAERFSREAKALASLNHPNLVAVYNFGKAGEHFWFAMEFVDGINLRQRLKLEPVEPTRSLEIVRSICDALAYAHTEGVVHRDIKPENILIDTRGKVKITDFGLAKVLGDGSVRDNLTMTNQAMGTPHYMAPEQIEHPTEVDHRADIFSLGVVFYELLTGELPLGRFPNPSEKVHVDVSFDQVVLKALQKEPALRYQTVGAVRDDCVGLGAPDGHSAATPKVKLASYNAKTEAAQGDKDIRIAAGGWRWPMIGCGCLILIALAIGGFLVLFVAPMRMMIEEQGHFNVFEPVPAYPAAPEPGVTGEYGMFGEGGSLGFTPNMPEMVDMKAMESMREQAVADMNEALETMNEELLENLNLSDSVERLERSAEPVREESEGTALDAQLIPSAAVYLQRAVGALSRREADDTAFVECTDASVAVIEWSPTSQPEIKQRGEFVLTVHGSTGEERYRELESKTDELEMLSTHSGDVTSVKVIGELLECKWQQEVGVTDLPAVGTLVLRNPAPAEQIDSANIASLTTLMENSSKSWTVLSATQKNERKLNAKICTIHVECYLQASFACDPPERGEGTPELPAEGRAALRAGQRDALEQLVEMAVRLEAAEATSVVSRIRFRAPKQRTAQFTNKGGTVGMSGKATIELIRSND